jgi:hypothetical protein
MISGRSRSANLFRRPFLEGSIGGGFVANEGDDAGWTTSAEVQGFTASPFPISAYGSFSGLNAEDLRERSYINGGTETDVSFTLEDEDFSGTGYIAAKPTPYDRVVAYVDARSDVDNIGDGLFGFEPAPLFEIVEIPRVGFIPFFLDEVEYERDVQDRSLASGLGWSHTFGYRNVANAAIFASGFERSSEETGTLALDPFDLGIPLISGREVAAEFNQKATIAALSHSLGIDDLTLRYGVEGGLVSQERSETDTISLDPRLGVPPVTAESEYEVRLKAARVYFDALYEISPMLQAEAGLFGTFLHSDEVTVDDADADPVRIERLEPRFGVAWEPVAGQWLRGGYIRESGAFASGSLAPGGIVGLQSNQLPLGVTGYSDTFAARWDAEWTDRFFTSVDFQHQEFDDISILIPGGITTIDLQEGRIDRLSGTANMRLGGGFGAFAAFAYADSENRDSTSIDFGEPVPFVPETAARLGLTWVNPANVKVTLAATYVGERTGDEAGTALDPYWTADAFLTWEPLDKRFALELAGYNLFNEEFDVAPSTPGWGRSFVGSFKVRF